MSWVWVQRGRLTALENKVRVLERENTQLSNEKNHLEIQLEEMSDEKDDLEIQVQELENEKGKLEKRLGEATKMTQVFSSQVFTLEYMVRELERKNIQLSGEKGKLEKQLEETTKATQLFSSQVSTLEYGVQELKHKNTELSGEKGKLEKQLEDTRKAGLLFMNAADEYQEVVEKQIKAKVDELKVLGAQKAEMDARVTSLESELQAAMAKKGELEHKNTKLSSEKGKLEKQLDDTRKAGLLIMNAADEYQEVVEKQIKAKVEELKVLGAQKAEMDAKAISLELELQATMAKKGELEADVMVRKREYELLEGGNDKLRSEILIVEKKHNMFEAEVKRLKMELCVLAEAKEVAVNAFDAEKAKIMKESEDLKRNVEEIHANKDLVEAENDKLRSKVLTMEQKHSMFEAEVKRLEMELGALAEAKEVVAMAFDAEKAEIMKEMKDLKRKVEEIQANKDLVESENDKLLLRVLTAEKKHRLYEAEVKRLQMELGALEEVKEAAVKAFDAEKVEIIKELEDHKRKVEEILASKDLLQGEYDKLRSELLTVEQKHILCEVEVKRLQMELGALAEAKEADANAFYAEKAKIMKESEDLKRNVEEIQTNKEATEEVGRDKDAQADRLRAELEELCVSMSQLQVSYDELEAKSSHLHDENNSVQKALDAEKVKACKLKSKIEALENYNAEKDDEIGKFKVAFEEKNGEIDVLSKDIELLHLAVAEAQRKKKCNIWDNLPSSRTCLSSCISK
ncbi:uncharacterized protein LOC133906030 [Phragmites australis]|uniref:uncharacterized protein LOC133906030 n=1 Tax=Phragmites australis TaxID=29695 RepID=UPI002D7989D7|nr:uncharacterized protein LOC133906030 [Phragmites australis]